MKYTCIKSFKEFNPIEYWLLDERKKGFWDNDFIVGNEYIIAPNYDTDYFSVIGETGVWWFLCTDAMQNLFDYDTDNNNS
jgi:hypothetical protein